MWAARTGTVSACLTAFHRRQASTCEAGLPSLRVSTLPRAHRFLRRLNPGDEGILGLLEGGDGCPGFSELARELGNLFGVLPDCKGKLVAGLSCGGLLQ